MNSFILEGTDMLKTPFQQPFLGKLKLESWLIPECSPVEKETYEGRINMGWGNPNTEF